LAEAVLLHEFDWWRGSNTNDMLPRRMILAFLPKSVASKIAEIDSSCDTNSHSSGVGTWSGYK